MNSVSYTAAFVAGVLSITSPCVLPVIPLYVAYLMGSSDRTRDRRRTLIVNAAAFVLGFSLEQMRRDLKDLERCVAEWSGKSPSAIPAAAE